MIPHDVFVFSSSHSISRYDVSDLLYDTYEVFFLGVLFLSSRPLSAACQAFWQDENNM